jgi:hypothetical protein
MGTLTKRLVDTAPDLDAVFVEAVHAARQGQKPAESIEVWAETRARWGFKLAATPLLTPPDANAKLAKGKVPSYGLTLQHTVTRGVGGMASLVVNACPWSTPECRAVCVLNNGNGGFPKTVRARQAKTDLWATTPRHAARLLAWELVKAVERHGRILFRPNVNSDVSWHRILPSLFDGTVLPEVTSYGYTKDPDTLTGNGWLGATYRVAYSWNERSQPSAVRDYLNRGGAVAIVTARKKGAPVLTRHPWSATKRNRRIVLADADVTDEWMFHAGPVVGDLSAKGKARSLIGTSKGFVIS